MCEIMQVVAEEARASYREEIIALVASNTLDDMEANCERVADFIAAYERGETGSLTATSTDDA